jgi:hypothetical protein
LPLNHPNFDFPIFGAANLGAIASAEPDDTRDDGASARFARQREGLGTEIIPRAEARRLRDSIMV